MDFPPLGKKQVLLIANNLDFDTFTVHAGGGVKIDISDLVYIRPGARFRWFEEREDDEIDQEITLAVGFQWGP